MPEVNSPEITWTPFFEGMQSEDYMTKESGINTFSAFESLHVDDLIHNDASSSASSSTSEVNRNPSSSLHTLPAWSSFEGDEGLHKSSPTYSDDVEEDSINDVWFAPTANLSRKKRINFGRELMAEEREVSPGASGNLKSYKSAPQLVRRIPSVDHKAKLEELLVEMGWPRETSLSMMEATDGMDKQGGESSSNFSSASQTGGSGGQSISSGAGSLASGMPATSALFKRRANMREGNMPAPSPVVVPRTEELDSSGAIPATSIPTLDLEHGHLRPDAQISHSRSATFPSSHDAFPTIASRQGPSSGPSYPSTLNMYNQNFISPSQHFMAQDNNERAIKAVEAALLYSMEPRRGSSSGDQHINFSPIKQPDTASTGSAGSELRTPITPFQALTTSELSGVPFDYQLPNAGELPGQVLSGGYQVNYLNKMKSQSDLESALSSNSLGLQDLQRTQPYQPAMIDSSSYAQIFAHMPTASIPSSINSVESSHRQKQPNLKQMRSSPNMRTSPSSDGCSSSTKSPLRKIASNRRLTGSSSTGEFIMPSPTKSPNKKGKSPKMAANTIALPPLPISNHFQQQPSSATIATFSNSGRGGAFQFVNYGVEDADELCSAVAPSGSYKIPLKGFGSGQDDEDGEDNDEVDQQQAGNSSSKSTRSRTKSSSNTRLGPRWQGLDDDQEEQDFNNSVATTGDKQSRQIKRRKSEASMTSLPGKRKTASSGNLKKKD